VRPDQMQKVQTNIFRGRHEIFSSLGIFGA